ncbi:shikimate dehydrogenase family protein [Anaeromicropila herbilytica]|uniref:Shikimate dehydrogenase substrate binding N-terminal domain-containing protein n=1 Tax=Anaeromicropila herbilytica TaxID=2785025 RepID=A0A7R7EKG1_9FIRM|nr:shikimate dehydrogenase [Anaeromicropila herbilytica]BCN30389.1 hypothetical protein bsdtb5_16840 [Anaeromicropila herbilytica]
MEYGLIGEKLGHSYSKQIHEKLADYKYEITPLTREEFPEFMKERNFKAINVTIPYKIDVMEYLDEVDENAMHIGSVNTIVNKDGKLIGHNTDFNGFLYMLRKNNIIIKDKKVIVIGNGGASKSILAVLNYLEAKDIVILYHKPATDTFTAEECIRLHADAGVIINTSPVGMYPNIEASPLDISYFTKCEAVVDVIYNPIETKLTLQAKSLNIKAITGLEMLVAQAKYAVEFFLEKEINDSVIHPIYLEIKKQLETF